MVDREEWVGVFDLGGWMVLKRRGDKNCLFLHSFTFSHWKHLASFVALTLGLRLRGVSFGSSGIKDYKEKQDFIWDFD